jgi:hypothetical protein
MKWGILPLAITLASCGSANTFVVDDPERLVRTATLQICGSDAALKRTGDSLRLTQSINCEGDGVVRLTYQDGGVEYCPVGYVDGGVEQKWLFRAYRSACIIEKV